MYESPALDAPLSQGDIIEGCPLLALDAEGAAIRFPARVIVLTQACDLAQRKTPRVVVALVRTAREIIEAKLLTPVQVKDQVRTHKMLGWYFLPAAPEPIGMPESIVEMRELHTIPLSILESLVADGKRLCRVRTPWREHLNQHFAVTYMRIGLPEPYATQA